jgi:hypothetical protein
MLCHVAAKNSSIDSTIWLIATMGQTFSGIQRLGRVIFIMALPTMVLQSAVEILIWSEMRGIRIDDDVSDRGVGDQHWPL